MYIHIGNNNVRIEKLMAEIWEHDKIAKKKLDGGKKNGQSTL